MVPGWLKVGKSTKDFLYLATVKTVFENTEEQISLLLEITFTLRSIHWSIGNISAAHICVTAAQTSRCGRCGCSLSVSMTVRHNIEHNWLLSRLKNIFHYLFFRLFIILHLHILMLNSLLSRTILIARKFLLKLIELCLFFLFISKSVGNHFKLIFNNNNILLFLPIFTALFLFLLLNCNFFRILLISHHIWSNMIILLLLKNWLVVDTIIAIFFGIHFSIFISCKL